MENDALHGDRDASVPVCSVEAYRGVDRVPVAGRPRALRPDGWLYLRNRGRLGARVRVRGIEQATARPRRTGGVDTPGDLGPGTMIRVDPASWEPVDIDLGPDASRMRSGIRYLRAAPDGSVLHVSVDEPLPDRDWDD